MTLLGPAFAFLSSFTWAIGSTRYSKLAKEHSAFAVNFCRAMIALPLFLLVVMLTSASFSQLKLEHLGWFAVSMIGSYSVGDVLFLMSTRSLGVPGALAIASCYPIWTAMVAAIFWKESLGGYQIMGLLITIAGVATVILNGPKSSELPASADRSLGKGVLLALMTSALWATNSVAIARAGQGVDSAVANCLRMALALVFIAAFNFFTNRGSPLLIPARVILSYGWVFALEAFGGSYFFMYGLSHSPLALGATLASLAPVIAVPIAVLFGLEKPSLYRTLGVCLTVLGLSLLVCARPDL